MASLAYKDPLSLPQVYQLLNWTRSYYPVFLALIFVICFITFGVVNSPKKDGKVTIHSMKGPGGRPLPVRRKSNNQIEEAAATRDFSPRTKIIFAILNSFVILCFALHGASLIIQVVTYRDDSWWPGQSAVVSIFFVLEPTLND